MPCAFRFAIKTTNNAGMSGTGGGPLAPQNPLIPSHLKPNLFALPAGLLALRVFEENVKFQFVAWLLHFSHALGMSQKLKLNVRGCTT